MYAHTRRIIDRMIDLLDEYSEGNLNLRSLVDGLEGSLNALEEKLPESFYSDWYDHWGGLEQILATGSERKHHKMIIQDIGALRALLMDIKTK